MTTVTPIVAQPGLVLTASPTTAVLAVGLTQIRSILVSNPTGASVTLALSLTRKGGSPIAVVPAESIGAMSSQIVDMLTGLVLNDGDALSGSGAGLILVASALGISS